MSELMQYMPYVGLILGFLARTVGLWLVKVWQENFRDESVEGAVDWKWRFLYGQLIAFVLICIAMPIITDFGQVAQMDFITSFGYAFGIASIGREIDKVFTDG